MKLRSMYRKINQISVYQEVKGVKAYVLLLKNYAKKTVVLTPLTPLTSELAKLELIK